MITLGLPRIAAQPALSPSLGTTAADPTPPPPRVRGVGSPLVVPAVRWLGVDLRQSCRMVDLYFSSWMLVGCLGLSRFRHYDVLICLMVAKLPGGACFLKEKNRRISLYFP